MRLILISNRVAIPTNTGAHRAGGLEVALAPTLKRYEGVWFGWSGNVVPRDQVRTEAIHKASRTYVLTDLSEEDHQEFYSGFEIGPTAISRRHELLNGRGNGGVLAADPSSSKKSEHGEA